MQYVLIFLDFYFLFFLYKIRILSCLIYVYKYVKLLSENLNPNFCPLPQILYKHLYLWSDHHVKGGG